MIRLLTAVLLFASFNVAAETQVPNDLNDGEVASAEEVMQNFQALATAIDNVSAGADGKSLLNGSGTRSLLSTRPRYPNLLLSIALSKPK